MIMTKWSNKKYILRQREMGFYEEVWVIGFLSYMLERGTPTHGHKKIQSYVCKRQELQEEYLLPQLTQCLGCG